MLRITGGEFRGRSLHTLPEKKDRSDEFLRPTQAKLRQALFNSIQTRIGGARVLDAFAGTGALGFEALSRGAEHVVFVELSPIAAQLIEKNAAALKVQDRCTLISSDLNRVHSLIQKSGPYDLVFADPPYSDDWEMKLLREIPWELWLSPEAWVCLEWGRKKSQVKELPEECEGLKKIREKIYGESILSTYQWVGENSE